MTEMEKIQFPRSCRAKSRHPSRQPGLSTSLEATGRWGRLSFCLLACALLAACGNKGDLVRLASAAPPVVPAGSDAPESPDQQTTPDAEAKPARSDELLRRSEERPTDEFDLPPQ